VIQVGTGAGVHHFHIHQDLICGQSPFFRAALNGDWKESKERKVKLPEDDPDAFHLYSNWLYHNTLISNNDSECRFKFDECRLLGKAYVLGDKLGDFEFMEVVMDGIMDIGRRSPISLTTLITTAYDHTPVASPLRCLLIDVYRFEGNRIWLDITERNEDMLWDLAYAFLGQKTRGAPYLTNPCLYHQHEKSGKPCYKTKQT